MNKQWFIWINSRQEGPFSVADLKTDTRLNPDTLVWKSGFKDWIKIRHVSELKEVFKESKSNHKPADLNPITPEAILDQQTLTIRQDPPQYILWLAVALLILLYLFYMFNGPL